MKAYAICCNDAIEFVVVDSDENRAAAKLSELKETCWEKNKYHGKWQGNRKLYDRFHYWHIHTVEADIYVDHHTV